MKVIVSHDVDHLTVWEHRRDLILPKFVVRSGMECLLGRIPVSEYGRRLRGMARNQWQNLDELMAFNRERRIPSTFFVGVSNGKGLAYSVEDAAYWIRRIIDGGFDCGVHGINFDSPEAIREEHRKFRSLSGLDSFGIRMHYLRTGPDTLSHLEKAGYCFDASVYAPRDPYRVGELVEFPLHIMDDYLIYGGGRLQRASFGEIVEDTRKIIDEAERKGLKFLTLLFHDRYYNEAFQSWKNWYIWIIDYLKGKDAEFVGFREIAETIK